MATELTKEERRARNRKRKLEERAKLTANHRFLVGGTSHMKPGDKIVTSDGVPYVVKANENMLLPDLPRFRLEVDLDYLEEYGTVLAKAFA